MCPCPLSRLLRTALVQTFVLLVLALQALSLPNAGAAERQIDIEVRAAGGRPCVLCRERDEISWPIRPSVQLFADILLPVLPIGGGVLEVGPYAKGAMLDFGAGEVPQVAAGLVLGYRWDRWELLVNGGLAYATERIGAQEFHPGQTKHTYDLGLWVRYHLHRFFIAGGYTHNSNGSAIGLNFAQGRGENPGFDQLFLGVGTRF